MKIEVKIRVDELHNKSSTSYHYADVTLNGDSKAVLQIWECLKNNWKPERIT